MNVIQEEEEDDDSLTRKGGAKKEVKVTVHNKKLLDVLMGGGDTCQPEMVPQKQKPKVGVSNLGGVQRVKKVVPEQYEKP